MADQTPTGPTFWESLKKFWLSIRSNPFVVAFEGGATGAAVDFIDDGLTAGHLDFSHAGIHKLITVAVIGGMASVRLLYRPAPGTNPKQ